MIVVGVDPGVKTGLVWVDIQPDGQTIKDWKIVTRRWEDNIPRICACREKGNARRCAEDAVCAEDMICVELPLDAAQWHGNPLAVAKCAVISGMYLSEARNIEETYDKVRAFLPSEWMLAMTAGLWSHRSRARRPSNDEIWYAFWLWFAPDEIKKEPKKREYMDIQQRDKYEHVRDAAMIALHGGRMFRFREKTEEGVK